MPSLSFSNTSDFNQNRMWLVVVALVRCYHYLVLSFQFRRAVRLSTLATFEDGGNAWAKSTCACCLAVCAASLSCSISSALCASFSVLNGVANGVFVCAGVSIRKRSGDVIGDSVWYPLELSGSSLASVCVDASAIDIPAWFACSLHTIYLSRSFWSLVSISFKAVIASPSNWAS